MMSRISQVKREMYFAYISIKLQSMIRKFCKEKIDPIAADVDKENKFPNHLWKEMGDLGILGITCPSDVIEFNSR